MDVVFRLAHRAIGGNPQAHLNHSNKYNQSCYCLMLWRAVYFFRFFYQITRGRLYSYTLCALCYPLLDYACRVYVRLSSIECFCISACQHSYREFAGKFRKNQFIETWFQGAFFHL